MLILRLKPGMIQVHEPLWCLPGSHGINTQQGKDKLHLMAGLLMRYTTEEWYFSSLKVPLESWSKHLPAVGPEERNCWGLFFQEAQPLVPVSANANARAHRNPSKSRVGMGLLPASSTAWNPCLGKRRVQAHGGSHALTPGLRVNSPCPGAVTRLLLILAWPKMKSTFQEQEGSPAPFHLPLPQLNEMNLCWTLVISPTRSVSEFVFLMTPQAI